MGSGVAVATRETELIRRRLRPRRISPSSSWLVVPAFALLVPVFIVPTALLLVRSFGGPAPGLKYYSEALSSGLFRSVMVRSIGMALSVTVISLVIGLPYAVVAARSGRRMRGFLLGAVGASMFLSVIVRAYAWLALLDSKGPVAGAFTALGLNPPALVHNRVGAVIGLVQYGIPFMVLAIYDVLRRLDGNYARAAATLGANALTQWRRVNLPLLMPGIMAGIVIVFITTLGYYVIPTVLGGPGDMMIGKLIAEQVGTTLNWHLGAAYASVLLLTTAVALVVLRQLQSKGRR